MSLLGLITRTPSICTQMDSLALSISPKNNSSAIKSVMKTAYKTMQALSHAVLSNILEHRNDLHVQITNFQQKFHPHIACVKQYGWQDLKRQLGSKMMQPFNETDTSLDDFRNNVNMLIADLTCLIGNQVLGLSQVSWSSCGTNGYNSDVDLTLKMAHSPYIIEEAVLYKTLRDCLHTYICGGLSGVQLDTESYIPHIAEYNISLFSAKAQSFFQTGEKASVVFQLYLNFHNNPILYAKCKEKDLHSITDLTEKETMKMLYNQVEQVMQIVEGKIQDTILEQYGHTDQVDSVARAHICKQLCSNNPNAYKEAREVTFIPLRMHLGTRCETIQKEIEAEFKKISTIKNQNPGIENHNLASCQQELDSLHLELQSTLILLAVLQNEGTISVAEGKATLFEEGGQIPSKIVKQRASSMSEFMEGKDSILLELSENPHFRRKASLPLTETLKAQNNISNEYALVVLGKDVEEILRPPSQRSTGQTFLIAAYEESMQLQHVILEGLNSGTNPKKVAIDSGKYALRTTRNLHKALKEFSEQPVLSKKLAKTLSVAADLEKKSAALEKCKRGESISTHAATILLSNIIIDGLTARGGTADTTHIHATIGKMFRNFDYGGIYFNSLLPKEEHVRIMIKTLQKATELFINIKNPHLVAILQAHRGFNRFLPEHKDLQAIHIQAADLTLEELKLTNHEEVRQFLDEIIELGAYARNIARKSGLFSVSTLSMAKFYNFTRIIKSNDIVA